MANIFLMGIFLQELISLLLHEQVHLKAGQGSLGG